MKLGHAMHGANKSGIHCTSVVSRRPIALGRAKMSARGPHRPTSREKRRTGPPRARCSSYSASGPPQLEDEGRLAEPSLISRGTALSACGLAHGSLSYCHLPVRIFNAMARSTPSSAWLTASWSAPLGSCSNKLMAARESLREATGCPRNASARTPRWHLCDRAE